MRDGFIKISVLRANGTAFPERVIGGKHYVQAESGEEFTVHGTIHRDQNGNYPASYVGTSLSLDGKAVSTGHKIDLDGCLYDTYSFTFRGFWQDDRSFKAFQFSTSYFQEDIVDVNNSKSNVGRMILKIWKYERTPLKDPLQSPQKKKIVAESIPKPTLAVDDSKKFWHQPSLETVAGRIHVLPVNNNPLSPSARWTCLGNLPLAELELRYHCETVLDLLEYEQIKTDAAIVMPTNNDLPNAAPAPAPAPAAAAAAAAAAAVPSNCQLDLPLTPVKSCVHTPEGFLALLARKRTPSNTNTPRKVVDLTGSDDESHLYCASRGKRVLDLDEEKEEKSENSGEKTARTSALD